jgi:hypothetical protein
MEQLDEVKDRISFRVDGDTERRLKYAQSKWPDLNISDLIKNIVDDWEQWDATHRGKTALMIYEAWFTRKTVWWFVRVLCIHVLKRSDLLTEMDELKSIYSMERWEREYRAGKENYNLFSEDS